MAISGNTDLLDPNQTVDGRILPNSVTTIVGAGGDTVTINGSLNQSYYSGPGNNKITYINGGGYSFAQNSTGDVIVNLPLGIIQNNGFGGTDSIISSNWTWYGCNALSLNSITIYSDSLNHVFDMGDVNATLNGTVSATGATFWQQSSTQFNFQTTSSNSLSLTKILSNKTTNLVSVGWASFSDVLMLISNPNKIQKYFTPNINQYYFAGGDLSLIFNTSNVNVGSQVLYSITNQNGNNQFINSGNNSGVATVSSNGVASVTLPISSQVSSVQNYSFTFGAANIWINEPF